MNSRIVKVRLVTNTCTLDYGVFQFQLSVNEGRDVILKDPNDKPESIAEGVASSEVDGEHLVSYTIRADVLEKKRPDKKQIVDYTHSKVEVKLKTAS